jgi:hypothetical protein
VENAVQIARGAARLAELGVDPAVLREAVARGEAARASCTDNDPGIFPGFVAWAKTVTALRDLLVPHGWQKERRNGLETVVAPDGLVAIAVVTGDDSTGHAGGEMRTKHARGPATLAAIEGNQLLLFAEIEPAPRAPHRRARPVAPSTWLLVIARKPDAVHCELALPTSIGEDNRIVEWAERLMLEPIALDAQAEIRPPEDEDDIEVEVTRRPV